MMAEHTAHVWPDQCHPIKAWVTCDGVWVARLDLVPLTATPQQLERFFRIALDNHMRAEHDQETTP